MLPHKEARLRRSEGAPMSVRAAARRYGISATTVQKWRSRQTSTDARMGPKEPRSSVLSVENEAVIVAFRRHTLLPLDDWLYALQVRSVTPHAGTVQACDPIRWRDRMPVFDCLFGPATTSLRPNPVGRDRSLGRAARMFRLRPDLATER
jgi:hypothetical protein